MACATFNPPPTTTTTLVRPLLLTLVPQQHQQQLQQPKVILTTTATPAISNDQHPLDLSNKNNPDLDVFIHGRTNSCSSTTSSTSTSSESYFDERRLKRKEQNKTAAHNYRQRKKSVSEQIEGEAITTTLDDKLSDTIEQNHYARSLIWMVVAYFPRPFSRELKA